MAEKSKSQSKSPVSSGSKVQEPLQIGIGAQYIKDLSFESPGAPQIFAPSIAVPEINVGINVSTRTVVENTYEVVLLIKLDAHLESKVAYIAELAYAGVFVVPMMQEEPLKLFLLVEAPRLLFPFARAVIANAVREGGFPAMMLAPIDFMALYQANKGSLGLTAAVGAA